MFVVLGVEDEVGEHHQCLIMDFGDVGVAGFGDAGGVEFALLRLDAEAETVPGGQSVAQVARSSQRPRLGEVTMTGLRNALSIWSQMGRQYLLVA